MLHVALLTDSRTETPVSLRWQSRVPEGSTPFAAASSSLPPARFATGSAVINMARQIGFVVGVAVLVTILGAPGTARGRLDAFDRGWLVVAGVAVAGRLAALTLRSARRTAETTHALVAVRR